MENSTTETCIYCGSDQNITKEHIPPRSYFPKPRPNNLITVPSCKKCNQGFSKDEEYFLAAFMFSEAGIKETGKAHWKQKLNRMYEKNHGLRRKIAQNLEYKHIHTPAGIYLGKRLTFKTDEDRVNKVAEKVIRGLYYFEYGEALKDTTQAHLLWLNTQQKFKMAEEHVFQLGFGKKQWPGIFEYRTGEVNNDNQESMWLIRFFGFINFMCTTSARSIEEIQLTRRST